MSKLRDEERAKRIIQEENDIILEIGKDGKEGVKAFKENQAMEQKIADAKRDMALEEIDKKKSSLYYNKYLSDLLLARLYGYIGIIPNWKFETMPSERGVVMEIKSPDGRIFRSAFEATKNPLLDLNAIDNFAIRVDATIEKVENEKRRIITA